MGVWGCGRIVESDVNGGTKEGGNDVRVYVRAHVE